ncbi:IS21 family transposase [Methanococcoides sp. SA1]|nr:IS21 family transposase [Methanococcoides sp. SA1]
MLKLKQKQEIVISHHRDGKSLRKIAMETGISRPTVTKYIEAYTKARENLQQSESDKSELIQEIVEPPKYDSSNRSLRKFTPEIATIVKDYLEANRLKKLKGQSKQQMKNIDIYAALKEIGHQISYSTLCEQINKIKEKHKETFIKQKYNPGEICEFDWGKVKLTIGGKYQKLSIAVFTSAYSNYRYAIVLPKEDMASFIKAHVDFFEHTKGVFARIDYDNLATAVKRFRGRSEREMTDDLKKLSTYYQFRPRFCNVARGNEKGHVERSVEYVRRKAFCRLDEFENIQQVNAHLQQTLDELNGGKLSNHSKTAAELFAEEKPCLYPALPAYEYAEIGSYRVDKYATISVKTSHYSVPEKYTGKMVTAKIFPLKIHIYNNVELICIHNRSFGFNEWILDINHYLTTLKRKPGAVAGSYALQQSPTEISVFYTQYFKQNPRDFIEILELLKSGKIGFEKVKKAVAQLIKIGSLEITADKIKMLCFRSETKEIYNDNDEILKYCQIQLALLADLIPNKETLSNEVGVL